MESSRLALVIFLCLILGTALYSSVTTLLSGKLVLAVSTVGPGEGGWWRREGTGDSAFQATLCVNPAW